MSTFRCPHCGGLNKVIPQSDQAHGLFESSAPVVVSPRRGVVGAGLDLLHFLKGGKASYNPQAKDVLTIRVEEISEDGRNWVLADLDTRITAKDMKTVAEYVLGLGWQFSRPNSTDRGLSQDKHNLIARELKRLNMLHVTKGNKSVLSPRGLALLRRVANEKI